MTTLHTSYENEPRSVAELIDRYRQVKRRFYPPKTSVRILAAPPLIKIPIAVDCEKRNPIAAFTSDPEATVKATDRDAAPDAKEIELETPEIEDTLNPVARFEVEIRTLNDQDPENREARAEAALKMVAKRTGFSPDQITARCRLAPILEARQEGMWAVRIATNWALAPVGHFFNGRDHASVLHSIRRFQKRATRNPELRAFMSEIERICAADNNCSKHNPNLGALT